MTRDYRCPLKPFQNNFVIPITMFLIYFRQFQLSSFRRIYYYNFNIVSAIIKGFRPASIVRPRHFLGTDNEDEIETILSDCESYSLHEYINSDKLFWPIIDFDLSREVYNSIEPKLTGKKILESLILAFRKTCLEIFLKWNPKTLAIASSSNAKKMSYHISTFGMRLLNIAQVVVFTELVHKKLLTPLQGNNIINNIVNKHSFSL